MKRTPAYILRSLVTAVLAAFLLAMPQYVTAKTRLNDKLENRPYADQKRWHLGFSVGGFFQSFAFTHNGMTNADGEQWYTDIPDLSPGFCVNVMGDLRLHKYLNLRLTPGMYFGSANARMRDYNSGRELEQTLKTAYVVVPLDLKISGDRLRNTRPYVTVGAMGAFDVSKRRSEYLWVKPTSFYLTVGLGCDFYLPFFKLNPEIKFAFGLNDMLKHDRPDLVDDPQTMKITESLKKMKGNMCIITFYFE